MSIPSSFQSHPPKPVGPDKIAVRCLRGQCPNCGNARIFASFLRIHRDCPSCGMRLERGDGYYLGPLCLNYGIVAFFFVCPILIAGFAGWMALETALAVALIGALLLPLGLYHYTWNLWLMGYCICLPEELHANRGPDCDDLSFEEEPRIRRP